MRLSVRSSRASSPGPVRLLIGGVHGREGRATRTLLEGLFREGPPRTGALIVVPVLSWGRPHVTTLSPSYYETVEGRRVLSLLEKYRPDIYLELHCYRLSAYEALTDPARRAAKGVPPLVDLEGGVLLGPVSPHLNLRHTLRLGLLLEVPCLPIGGRRVALELMRTVRDATDHEEVFRWLTAQYGERFSGSMDLLKRCG